MLLIACRACSYRFRCKDPTEKQSWTTALQSCLAWSKTPKRLQRRLEDRPENSITRAIVKSGSNSSNRSGSHKKRGSIGSLPDIAAMSNSGNDNPDYTANTGNQSARSNR